MSVQTDCRLARPDEAEQFIAWSRATQNNLFDPDAALYRSSVTLVATDSEGPVVYCPLQRPIFMEALAIKPGAAIRSIARSLKELVLKTCGIAKQSGVGEVYFFCQDPSTERFAENNGFQRMNFTLYRARVKDIEQRYELT